LSLLREFQGIRPKNDIKRDCMSISSVCSHHSQAEWVGGVCIQTDVVGDMVQKVKYFSKIIKQNSFKNFKKR